MRIHHHRRVLVFMERYNAWTLRYFTLLTLLCTISWTAWWQGNRYGRACYIRPSIRTQAGRLILVQRPGRSLCRTPDNIRRKTVEKPIRSLADESDRCAGVDVSRRVRLKLTVNQGTCGARYRYNKWKSWVTRVLSTRRFSHLERGSAFYRRQ